MYASETLHFEQPLFNKLGTSRLNSKISLCKSYLRFARVPVLRNQVACVACQQHVIYLTFST